MTENSKLGILIGTKIPKQVKDKGTLWAPPHQVEAKCPSLPVFFTVRFTIACSFKKCKVQGLIETFDNAVGSGAQGWWQTLGGFLSKCYHILLISTKQLTFCDCNKILDNYQTPTAT